MIQKSERRLIEVRSFKWPQQPVSVTVVQLLGEDEFGCWLGVALGTPWRADDHSRAGVLEQSLVKLVPHDTFWSVCFHPVDPVVDVDIILPVRWEGDVLEEVDLELDILRNADGTVYVRDQDKFEQVRLTESMPDDIVAQALATCEHIRDLVERGAEPFGNVGHSWLARFLSETKPQI